MGRFRFKINYELKVDDKLLSLDTHADTLEEAEDIRERLIETPNCYKIEIIDTEYKTN